MIGRLMQFTVALATAASLIVAPVYAQAQESQQSAQQQGSSQEPAAPLAVVVFPLAAGEHSAYRLYEDASNTPAYQSNVAPRAFAWTNISAAEQASDGFICSLAFDVPESDVDAAHRVEHEAGRLAAGAHAGVHPVPEHIDRSRIAADEHWSEEFEDELSRHLWCDRRLAFTPAI